MKESYLFSQEGAFNTEFHSFSTIHRANARQALSRVSRVFVFLITGLVSDLGFGFANIELGQTSWAYSQTSNLKFQNLWF